MTALLLDQGIPRTAAEHLRSAGWDAVHVGELGLSRASDVEILNRGRHDGRCCVTLDADFHAVLAVQGATAPSVVRIRIEGLKAAALVELLVRVWPRIEAEVSIGAVVSIGRNHLRVRRLPLSRSD